MINGKLVGMPKTDIKAFIREFERLIQEYKNSVDIFVAKIVIHPDLASKMTTLKNYI